VTGIDFSPASIAYARELAEQNHVAERCTFIEQDVRTCDFGHAAFDAAFFLYGQLAVFRKTEAQSLLAKIAQALTPGGSLVVELLNQERVDKQQSTWWYTADRGLWGDAPFLQLGERFWDAEQALSIERFYILHLETGQSEEIYLCDQTYAVTTIKTVLGEAGFAHTDAYQNWDNLPLYDAAEWVVYVAQR
jgi:SAM-dependent methyltransferase